MPTHVATFDVQANAQGEIRWVKHASLPLGTVRVLRLSASTTTGCRQRPHAVRLAARVGAEADEALMSETIRDCTPVVLEFDRRFKAGSWVFTLAADGFDGGERVEGTVTVEYTWSLLSG
jgi:hypothetical protein